MQHSPFNISHAVGFEVMVRHVVSTVLPYCIVFGSVLLKLPQIIKVLRSRSADGISIVSLAVELVSCAVSTGWGVAQSLKFKDYGESALIMIEMFLLLLIVGYLQKKLSVSLLVSAVVILGLVLMTAGYIPRNVHEGLLRLQILFVLSSRLPQILMSYRNKSTGQLSALTFFLAMGGGVSRLLTTFCNVPSDKGRNVMLAQFGVVVFLNFVIVVQCMVYNVIGSRRVADMGAKRVYRKNK